MWTWLNPGLTFPITLPQWFHHPPPRVGQSRYPWGTGCWNFRFHPKQKCRPTRSHPGGLALGTFLSGPLSKPSKPKPIPSYPFSSYPETHKRYCFSPWHPSSVIGHMQNSKTNNWGLKTDSLFNTIIFAFSFILLSNLLFFCSMMMFFPPPFLGREGPFFISPTILQAQNFFTPMPCHWRKMYLEAGWAAEGETEEKAQQWG